jgi:hypothetical protein
VLIGGGANVAPGGAEQVASPTNVGAGTGVNVTGIAPGIVPPYVTGCAAEYGVAGAIIDWSR